MKDICTKCNYYIGIGEVLDYYVSSPFAKPNKQDWEKVSFMLSLVYTTG
jgi:hypothetical protein